jgi:ATP-dependent Lon protease
MKINKEVLIKKITDDTINIDWDSLKKYIDQKLYKSEKIHDAPVVGMINGLYATTSGRGGIVPIQIMQLYGEKTFVLKLTGSLGDVMKESIQCAYTTALNYIKMEGHNIDQILEKYTSGFHIHAPCGATPKDGPSAGAAFTLAFISILLNKKIDNEIGITGEIELTGKAGDVMKESVQYSLKVAWSLLTKEEQDTIIEDSNNKKSFGIHIHCPDGATPKDGPSAGLAFTLAIYSLLTGKKVNNKICMTGEVDLQGESGIIGGLESKLPGGKKAGCTLALIPKDNMEDLERMRREGLSPEDDNFKVLPVTHIKEILLHAIV